MPGIKQVTMGTPPQTHDEPIREGEFRNLSSAQIERILKVWIRVERHASMTQEELLTLFDSRPESIDRDTNALENVIYILGPRPHESSDHGTDPALVAN